MRSGTRSTYSKAANTATGNKPSSSDRCSVNTRPPKTPTVTIETPLSQIEKRPPARLGDYIPVCCPPRSTTTSSDWRWDGEVRLQFVEHSNRRKRKSYSMRRKSSISAIIFIRLYIVAISIFVVLLGPFGSFAK